MTHDLNCHELIEFMHTVIDLFETDIGLENMRHVVPMLFKIIHHFWVYCA